MARAKRPVGLQTEVMLSLVLVMGLATAVLAWVFFTHHESTLRRVMGAALLAEVRAPQPPAWSLFPGTTWWWLEPDGRVASSAGSDPPDEVLLEMAEEARVRNAPLLRPGALAEPIRFAAPVDGRGRVAVARLPAEVSRSLRVLPMAVFATLAIGNLAVFTAVGALLLRRRVVLPLRTLCEGARRIAEGHAGLRVDVAGPLETEALASAFNEMTEALEGRSSELEKAVVDLREANRELRETREGLDRAERLAAVGTLAAGVAHEVGNPMGALLTFVDLAEREEGVPEASRGMLERAKQQGERVRRILRQLLDFSRPSVHETVPFDLVEVARATAELVRPQSTYREIDLEVICEQAVPLAVGDPGIVGQILLDLLLNAGHASRDRPGARVCVHVRAARMDRRTGDRRRDERGLPAGGLVECLVADQGEGVPEADRDRIFTPFFTTKDPSEGTGLGLSTAARQAEEMGGALDLTRAAPPMRTAFVLRLPAVRERAEAPGDSAIRAAAPCGVRKGLRSGSGWI